MSACLLGENTRYDGKNNYDKRIEDIKKKFDIVPVCPEVLGGLKTPRLPSEIKNSFVYNNQGKDVTNHFVDGAMKALNAVHFFHIKMAVLVERSPSCGIHEVHNGYFNGQVVKGEGITTTYLKHAGVQCFTLDEFIAYVDEQEKNKEVQKEAYELEKEAFLEKKAQEEKELAERKLENPDYNEDSRNQDRYNNDRNDYQDRRSYPRDDSRPRRDYDNRKYGSRNYETRDNGGYGNRDNRNYSDRNNRNYDNRNSDRSYNRSDDQGNSNGRGYAPRSNYNRGPRSDDRQSYGNRDGNNYGSRSYGNRDGQRNDYNGENRRREYHKPYDRDNNSSSQRPNRTYNKSRTYAPRRDYVDKKSDSKDE